MKYAPIIFIFSLCFQALIWTQMPYDTDSFFFMRFEQIEPPTGIGSALPMMVHEHGVHATRMILAVMAALISVLMYLIIRRWMGVIGSLSISALFTLDPIWTMQSANIVDKNMIYMLALMVAVWLYQDKMIYTLMIDKQAAWVKHAGYIVCIFIALSAWEGWPLIAALIAVVLFNHIPMRIKIWIYTGISALIVFMLGNRLGAAHIVNEMRPAYEFMSPIYALYIIIIVIYIWVRLNDWLDGRRKPWFNDIFFITIFAACIMFRNIIFMIPIIYIAGAWTFLTFTKGNTRIRVLCISLILSFFIIVLLMLSVPAYMRSSVWSPDMEKALIYADGLNTTCVMTDWGIGNIAQYYTNKSVPMSGHPQMEFISYYILNDSSDCVFVYSIHQDEAFQKYALIMDHPIDIYDRKIIKGYNDWKVSVYTRS
jgi:hypothetical protein